jgi:hypothetical protein
MNLKEKKVKIEESRDELHSILDNGQSEAEILRLSQKLDSLIVEHQKELVK